MALLRLFSSTFLQLALLYSCTRNHQSVFGETLSSFGLLGISVIRESKLSKSHIQMITKRGTKTAGFVSHNQQNQAQKHNRDNSRLLKSLSTLCVSNIQWFLPSSTLMRSKPSLRSLQATTPTSASPMSTTTNFLPSVPLSSKCQLAQLASMTTLSIDSGDLETIRAFALTGYITDATTNPLFVSQAGLNSNENPLYAAMVNDAVIYAVKNCQEKSKEDVKAITSIAIDRLAVNLGESISKIVPGYVSTEVDPRLSFDTNASVEKALQIIAMYNELGVAKERILIKIAATWEGIKAAEILERDYKVQCNLTLIFSVVQAIACAQYGIHLISPFPGRILDWHKVKSGRTTNLESPDHDEGVIACKDMYNYYKVHNHKTICMPASWRPSRGAGYELDEIIALAGTDRMTIPAPLLSKLVSSEDPIERKLSPDFAKSVADLYPLIDNGMMTEKDFRYRMNMDGCGTDKLAEGIRAFIAETEKLEAVLSSKVQEQLIASTPI